MVTKNNLNLPNESLRLEVKELADETRIRYGLKGISDIFEMLSEVAFLIRKPLEYKKLSGFCFYYDDQFIVFLNSSLSLGHERFTGAHELYHILYNSEILKKEKILMGKDSHKIEDNKADIFAAELLMPETYVRQIYSRLINVDMKNVMARHVIIMHNHFKVSYKAMLKRLIQLDLCSLEIYEDLLSIASIENTDELKLLEKNEGFSIELIVPANKVYVSSSYISYIKDNYINNKISYNNLLETLSFIDLKPEDLGVSYPEEEY